jgi:hypothetical protein
MILQMDFGFAFTRLRGAFIKGSNIYTSIFRDFNEVLTWLEVELEDNELISE